jgi:Tol biopolymer transport system component
MPDVQEVFRMATQKVLPDPGALERQNRNQRRRSTRRKAGAYTLVAALVAIGIVVALVTLPNHGAKTQKPATSPTGTIGVPAGTQHGIQIVSLFDGSVQREIGGLPADAAALTLSPDGTKVAYVTASHGDFGFCGGCSPGPRIVVVGLDGSGSHYVTGPLTTTEPPWSLHPAWSPDGSKIAFAAADPSNGNSDIYVVDAGEAPSPAPRGLPASDHPRKLTTSPAVDEWPSWSPDGSRIVYANSGSTELDASGFSPTSELYTIPAAGGKPVRLTQNDVPDTQPAFSPDGTQIAFFRDTSIWVMNADGSDARGIVPLANCFSPQWSPDGTRIAFLEIDQTWQADLEIEGRTGEWPVLTVRAVDAKTDLHRIGGQPHTVQVATDWNTPQWLPSGDALLVSRVVKP